MQIKEARKRLAVLKSTLKAEREKCKMCERWECGYCGVPKWNLEHAIERLEAALASRNETGTVLFKEV